LTARRAVKQQRCLSHLQVGKVIEVEKFATNFDDGLLSYMQLPSDPGALKTVYELTRAVTIRASSVLEQTWMLITLLAHSVSINTLIKIYTGGKS
jgi:hypothetical protein